MKRVLFLFPILCFLVAPLLHGQGISEELCNRVFDAIDSVEKPRKVYRRDIYRDDCSYEFVVSDGSVWVSIEKLPNKKESRRAFDEGTIDVYGDRRKRDSYKATYPWDEIALFKSSKKHDSYLLLRENLLVITIFADVEFLFRRFEKILAAGVSPSPATPQTGCVISDANSDDNAAPTPATRKPGRPGPQSDTRTSEQTIRLAKKMDWDCDGISNFYDNCPNKPNPNQEDKNRNKVGDVCEQPQE